jgi:hypothetical protein
MCHLSFKLINLRKLNLNMERNLQAFQFFAIYPCYEKSNFVSFEGGVGRVLEGVRYQQDALE